MQEREREEKVREVHSHFAIEQNEKEKNGGEVYCLAHRHISTIVGSYMRACGHERAKEKP